MRNATFRLLTASLLQVMGRLAVARLSYHGGLLQLVHFNLAIVTMYHGFLRRSLVSRASLVSMFSFCRHTRFRYFGSVVPFYVI